MTTYPPGTQLTQFEAFENDSILSSPSQTYWMTIGGFPSPLPVPSGELAIYRGNPTSTASAIYTHPAPTSNSDGYFIMLSNEQLVFFGGDASEGEYDYEWETPNPPTSPPAIPYWYLNDDGVVEIVSPTGSWSYNAFDITADPPTEFEITGVTYNLDAVDMQSNTLDTLFQETYTNNTSVQQTNTITDTWSLTSTYSFSATLGIKLGVKVSGTVGLPTVVGSGTLEVSAEVDVSFTVGVTESYVQQWSLQQPVAVPPDSSVTATVSISKATYSVPYTVTGNYVYKSGATAPASVSGTLTNVTGYNFQVVLQQGSGASSTVKVIKGPAPTIIL